MLTAWRTGGQKNETPMMKAIAEDKEDCLEMLIKGGADLNYQTKVCAGV